MKVWPPARVPWVAPPTERVRAMELPLDFLMPVWLRPADQEAAPWANSLVLDFEKGVSVLIGVPMLQGHELELEPGSLVALRSAHADGMRVFEAMIRAHVAEPTPGLALSWPNHVERIQRRESARVTVDADAVAVYAPEGSSTVRNHAVTLADVSVTGVRLHLSEPVAAGSEVRLTLDLPGCDPGECVGHVVRAGERITGETERPFWAGIEFVDPSERLQRDLTRFIFDVQRQQRRAG